MTEHDLKKKFKQEFASRLRAALAASDFKSSTELFEALRPHPLVDRVSNVRTVQNWLNGTGIPQLMTLSALCDCLSVNVGWLSQGIGPMSADADKHNAMQTISHKVEDSGFPPEIKTNDTVVIDPEKTIINGGRGIYAFDASPDQADNAERQVVFGKVIQNLDGEIKIKFEDKERDDMTVDVKQAKKIKTVGKVVRRCGTVG